MECHLSDYLIWRGDLSFQTVSFNEIDALALSTAMYVELDGIVSSDFNNSVSFCDAAKLFEANLDDSKYNHVGRMIPDEVKTLFINMAKCERYKDLQISGYINHIDENDEMQFAAVTFQNKAGEIYVVFRGTDDNLIGWREDFNMAFLDVVPAQEVALIYLRKVFSHLEGNVYVMGHSKGGNLAVFSSAKCGRINQTRIKNVYCLDGPGFSEKFLLLKGYENIGDKVLWYLPTESMVGTLMMHGRHEFVIKSNGKGLLQHNPFNWHLTPTSFVAEQTLSKEAILMHRAVDACMTQMTLEQRKQFVTAIFDTIDSTSAKTLSDIRLKNVISLIDSVKKADAETRDLWKEMGHLVLKTVKDNR